MMVAENVMTATDHTFMDYSDGPVTAVSKQDQDVELRFDDEEEMELTVSRPTTSDEVTIDLQQQTDHLME